MYSVLSVADDILKLAKKRGCKLTPLQLMKLTYIAHGFSLAALDKDLFSERIEAWKYGPVIPDLYHVTKKFGRNSIPFDLIGDEEFSTEGDQRSILQEVVDKYGKLSGYALSSLTHEAGSPWEQVYREGCQGLEIPDSIIREHYKKLLHERESTPAS